MRCGKVIYPNASLARKYKKKAKNLENVELNFYYCEFCEGFHLTKMSKKAQQCYIKNIRFAMKNKIKKEMKE